MSFHVGEHIGDYEIVGITGAGSMGRVFKVEHRLTKRREAVKVLSAELATEVQIKRFEREIALQAQLSHPNIATVHNAFRWEGCLVLVMEFLEGQTLEKLLRQGRLPITTSVKYIRQTLSALAHAHDRGVIHRDVTPANLFITADGTVKLTDFGVSKSFGDPDLTKCGDIVGSLDYMAPEQARGALRSDSRCDLYSVGAVLYEMLTGVKPFGDQRGLGAMVTDAEKEPSPPTEIDPEVPAEWNEILAKALMRHRECRYSSAADFLKAIDRVTLTARGVSGFKPFGQWRSLIAAASIAVAALVVPAVFWGKPYVRDIPHPQAAIFHIPPPSLETLRTSSPTRLPHAGNSYLPQNIAVHHVRTTKPLVTVELAEARQIADDSTISDDSEPTETLAPKKARFWSKLNPFKRRNRPAQ